MLIFTDCYSTLSSFFLYSMPVEHKGILTYKLYRLYDCTVFDIITAPEKNNNSDPTWYLN